MRTSFIRFTLLVAILTMAGIPVFAGGGIPGSNIAPEAAVATNFAELHDSANIVLVGQLSDGSLAIINDMDSGSMSVTTKETYDAKWVVAANPTSSPAPIVPTGAAVVPGVPAVGLTYSVTNAAKGTALTIPGCPTEDLVLKVNSNTVNVRFRQDTNEHILENTVDTGEVQIATSWPLAVYWTTLSDSRRNPVNADPVNGTPLDLTPTMPGGEITLYVYKVENAASDTGLTLPIFCNGGGSDAGNLPGGNTPGGNLPGGNTPVVSASGYCAKVLSNLQVTNTAGQVVAIYMPNQVLPLQGIDSSGGFILEINGVKYTITNTRYLQLWPCDGAVTTSSGGNTSGGGSNDGGGNNGGNGNNGGGNSGAALIGEWGFNGPFTVSTGQVMSFDYVAPGHTNGYAAKAGDILVFRCTADGVNQKVYRVASVPSSFDPGAGPFQGCSAGIYDGSSPNILTRAERDADNQYTGATQQP
jgi:hypothetical protein